ncbi:MAG: PilZ domain-containing protein [Vulcanimicrobiota bacterium]
MSNRRIWPRVNGQAPVSGGYTLNVSLRGARIVTRHPMKSRVRILMDLGEVIELEAEPMWQQELGTQNRVVGLRFKPDARQEAILAAWMQRQAS